MSLVNKNKQFEKETITKISKVQGISYDIAYEMFSKLSQKKKRKLITTYLESKG